MMRFWKKVFLLLIICVIFHFSTNNVFSSCDVSKLLDDGVVTGNSVALQTNESLCFTRKNEVEKFNIRHNEGTDVRTCNDEGEWEWTEDCINKGFINPFRCSALTSTSAKCIKAEIRCSSPDREPNGTVCRNSSIWKCDGFNGEYYESEICKEKEGSSTKCFDLEGPAKCVKTQCVDGNRRREIGQSTCIGEYLNKCLQSGDNDAKFSGNKPENFCEFGCIEQVEGFAKCLSSSEGKTKCIDQDNNLIIQRTKGQTACFSDETLRQCSKERDGVFSIIQNCKDEGKKCKTINSEGIGECVDLSEPESPFEPPGITTTSGGTNAFCQGNGPDSPIPKISTALGCIPIEVGPFMAWLLPFVFGITGGIAFLLMVSGFISMTFSGGDPKKIQGAKETITAALTGLLISVFSLFILRLIAVNILKIPGIN